VGFEYKPTATGLALHESDAFFKGMVGPFASGKSTAMAMDMLYSSLAQPPGPDGVRHTRWGVIRASYPNLLAARKTLLEVMPEGSGTITEAGAPFKGLFKFALNSGDRVQIEIEMWSSQTSEDARKFRSSNWTGCWINEASEVSIGVVLEAMARVGRFPVMAAGGCRWGGVMMDFNHPEDGHWIRAFFAKDSMEMRSPDTGEIRRYPVDCFRQPPAAFRIERDGEVHYEVNPQAENLENLDGGTDFYGRQIAALRLYGKTDELDGLYCMLDVASMSGRPVWPSFRQDFHVASSPLKPIEGAQAIVGFDTSGIHPAVVVGQFHDGRWKIIDELAGSEEGLESFLHAGLIPLVKSRYPRSEIIVAVDPADARDAYTGLAPTNHLMEAGFRVYRPQTNNPETRIAAVAVMLNRDKGGLLVSPACEGLIAAMRGGYRYSRLRARGTVDVIYRDRPEKNEHSHLADALQYLALCAHREAVPTPAAIAASRKLAARNAQCRRIM
jgi:hypothetical protein